ncbi:hypothetical protein [Helicobacter gastrocanis]|uniref:hypothetical protein n=1 Tax=Helicobacter gastrocanis TaxID=2849641 RepID=UPI001C860AA8|nr:hypothetical protein [Helicobacter sp. NHP19-003]
MDQKFKNTSASLAAALCSPFLEADIEIDKDGFQRTDVIWCCTADGQSFPNPPSWARPDFDPKPPKRPVSTPPGNTTQTPTPGNTTQHQSATPTPPTAPNTPVVNTKTPPIKDAGANPPPFLSTRKIRQKRPCQTPPKCLQKCPCP